MDWQEFMAIEEDERKRAEKQSGGTAKRKGKGR